MGFQSIGLVPFAGNAFAASTIASSSSTAASSFTKGVGLSVPTLPNQSETTQIAWLKDMHSLGITWVRFDLEWSIVQPSSVRTYNWSKYDMTIGLANKYGISVDAIIDYPPLWARDSRCASTDSKCQPAHTQTYANYAAAVVVHYTSRLGAVEIWNEPNNVGFWHPAPDPAFYTRMLQLSYQGIKKADPSMRVISGGLATVSAANGSIPGLIFAEDMYSDGAKGYFDALGDHPYSYPAVPADIEGWSAWTQMSQTSVSLRSIMAKYGDSAKPIWMTEVGAPTGGPGLLATCTNENFTVHPDHDDQCLQAENYSQAIKDANAYSWAGPVFLYSYKDIGTSETSNENFFGLLNYNGTPKESYYAVKSAIAATK
jgi:hypothetical protein